MTSFPVASATVLYAHKYGAAFGHVMFGGIAPSNATCPLDEEYLDGIWDEFVNYVTTGEMQTLLSDAQALTLQLGVIADATGSQSIFAATSEFSMMIDGDHLITTGVTVSGTPVSTTAQVEPDPGSWDEAVINAAATIAAADLDQQFHPIAMLNGATFDANVEALELLLAGYSGIRVDPVLVAWGENGSRLFSRVTKDGERYMIADTELGTAYGPYTVVAMEQPYVGDALAPYMNNYQTEHVAVMAVLTLCMDDTVAWNLPSVSKPTYWPAPMPAWPTLAPPAAPGILEWRCGPVSTSGCECVIIRKQKCKRPRALLPSSCEERVKCVWFPGTTPSTPANCPPDKPNPPPTELPVPPGGNDFCEIEWRVN